MATQSFGGAPAKIQANTLSLNRVRKALISTDLRSLPIVAEANTENSRFAPESAFRPLHRFGDLCDRCSRLRMR
jgi:hypothetical protein